MVEIQHFAHHCTSSLSETAGIDGTCSLCFKETSIHYTCHACGFELCKSCFKLSDTKLTHGLHPQHLLHFHLRQSDEKPQSFVCCGCGFVSAGSYYECKECEIKIDLECISKEIAREWEEKSIYHYSHRHMLRLCRLGADFSSSCLMCDGDVSCTTRCYGCVYCLYFIHEWCIDLPREIRHPVHPPHSLRRLNYVQHGERKIICNACQDMIYGIPFGCIECKFNLHIECADSLLRGLEHESHSHALFYVARNALYAFTREKPCHICKSSGKYFKNSYYRCVKCDLNFHLECLKLPSLLSSRSRHPHPLWCKTFDESCDNHCEFCETVISDGSHAYYCKECEFYAHVECIFRKEKPSPMYLRSLYSYDAEDVSRGNEGTDGGSYSGDTDGDQLKIFDVTHTHMLQRFDDMGGVSNTSCSVCKHKLDIRAYRCVFHVSGKCEFVAHEACAKLGQQSTRRFHRSHPLTLLPVPPAQNMECDMCKKAFKDFNLFCRTCDYVICLRCARGDTRLVQKVARGKKTCMAGHNLVQFFERSKPVDCSICDEIVHGKGSACPQCEETYHDQCLQLVGQSVVRPSHSPYHSLYLRGSNGGMRCADCRRKVRNYGYICTDDPCMWGPIFYHVKCPEATLEVECHEHNLRCFRAHIDQSGSITNLECNACRKPCNVDCFYGCEKCSLSYHVECLGLLVHAKYKEFFWHIMRLRYSLTDMPSSLRCDRCKSPFDPVGPAYKCELCDCALHLECLLPLDKDDIALTREERDLELVKSLKVYDRETQKDYCTKDVLDRRDVSERISALEKSEFLMHLHAECEANWNATVTKSDFLRALLKGGSKMRHVEEAVDIGTSNQAGENDETDHSESSLESGDETNHSESSFENHSEQFPENHDESDHTEAPLESRDGSNHTRRQDHEPNQSEDPLESRDEPNDTKWRQDEPEHFEDSLERQDGSEIHLVSENEENNMERREEPDHTKRRDHEPNHLEDPLDRRDEPSLLEDSLENRDELESENEENNMEEIRDEHDHSNKHEAPLESQGESDHKDGSSDELNRRSEAPLMNRMGRSIRKLFRRLF